MRLIFSMLTIMLVVALAGVVANTVCPPHYNTPEDVELVPPIDTDITPPDVEEPTIEIPSPPESVEDEEPEIIDISGYASEEELEMLAKLVYGEARGIASDMEKAAVVWCVLNRVDVEDYACGVSIKHVVTFPGQFDGYNRNHPVWEDLYALAEDVVTRWVREKLGEIDVGRILPPDYLWFRGDGSHNHFRNKYSHYSSDNLWDWSLDNPYED